MARSEGVYLLSQGRCAWLAGFMSKPAQPPSNICTLSIGYFTGQILQGVLEPAADLEPRQPQGLDPAGRWAQGRNENVHRIAR